MGKLRLKPAPHPPSPSSGEQRSRHAALLRAADQAQLGGRRRPERVGHGPPEDPAAKGLRRAGILQLQHQIGNVRIARQLAKRQEGVVTPAPGATSQGPLIVDDTVTERQAGQLTKGAFLARLRPAVDATIEAELSGTTLIGAARDQVVQQFARYSALDAATLDRTIKQEVPGASAAREAHDYIALICARIHVVIAEQHASLPPGAETAATVAGGVGKLFSNTARGIGSLIAGIGNIFFKARAGGAARPDDPGALQVRLGRGQELDVRVRSGIEAAFGRSFSEVRIHTDSVAAGLSDRLNARAFTVGQDIAFGAGEYQPGTLAGDALIAHEVAHVAQQQGHGAGVQAKGEGEDGSLEADADRSAVGAVLAMWGIARGGAARLDQDALPQLTSGLRLQRCAGTHRPGQTAGPAATPAALPTDWPQQVTAAQELADQAQQRASLGQLAAAALSGIGIQLHVANTSPAGVVNPDDYQPAPTVNFDLYLNTKTAHVGSRKLSSNAGYSFSRGNTRYAVIGPEAIKASSPLYTRMYAQHELYHTTHHLPGGGQGGRSDNDEELETWTQDFRSYFHQFRTLSVRPRWHPLLQYYEGASRDAQHTAVNQLVAYYNNPPVPVTEVESTKETFRRWLHREQNISSHRGLLEALNNRLNLSGP